MQLHDNIIEYIETEARRRGWVNKHTNEVSCACLAREVGFTRATWSRILRKQQKTISDEVVDAILNTFNIRALHLLDMSIGNLQTADLETQQHTQINEASPAYGSKPFLSDEQVKLIDKLAEKAGITRAEWIRQTLDDKIEQFRPFLPES